MKHFLFAFLVWPFIGFSAPSHEPLNGDSNWQNGLRTIPQREGTLVIPIRQNCTTLKVFFPGHAHELGYKGVGDIPDEVEHKWNQYLLGEGAYYLGPAIEKSQCPVFILGDSNKTISEESLKSLLNFTKTSKIEILSHSGGFVGLNQSLSKWPQSLVNKISKIQLLDNLYSSSLAKTMRDRFGEVKLKSICSGFYTPQNSVRYNLYYKKICPNMRAKNANEHKSEVINYF